MFCENPARVKITSKNTEAGGEVNVWWFCRECVEEALDLVGVATNVGVVVTQGRI